MEIIDFAVSTKTAGPRQRDCGQCTPPQSGHLHLNHFLHPAACCAPPSPSPRLSRPASQVSAITYLTHRNSVGRAAARQQMQPAGPSFLCHCTTLHYYYLPYGDTIFPSSPLSPAFGFEIWVAPLTPVSQIPSVGRFRLLAHYEPDTNLTVTPFHSQVSISSFALASFAHRSECPACPAPSNPKAVVFGRGPLTSLSQPACAPLARTCPGPRPC